MQQYTQKSETAQPVVWDYLEAMARQEIQRWLQGLLEEEVTEFLGRAKSARRTPVDGGGYRNGYGKPRRVTLGNGTVEVKRPRVRDLEQRFSSKVLPLFARRTPTVNTLLPQLYLHGLAAGDFDLAMRGLLGEDAPISASTILRLKEQWQAEREAWNARRLDDLEVVYLWADGVYLKAGLEKADSSCVLVLVAGLADGRKIILALQAGHRESGESWAALLRDLKRRGLRSPKLVIADGALGLWAGLRQVFPAADEQRCWNHRTVNLVDRVAKRHQGQATALLRKIAYAETAAQAVAGKDVFQRWCEQHQYADAARLIDEDWERMVTFFRYPRAHWVHLRTTNPVESPFAALRLRTDAAKRFKRVDSATAMVWKLLLVSEQHFRRLNAPHLLRDVWEGATYKDGVRVDAKEERTAA